MSEEIELVMSPFCQDLESGGHSVRVEIYGSRADEWILEVEDEYGNSTVWDDHFATDAAALAEVKKTVLSEGIESLIGPPPGKRAT
jgi:hypothetical protein